MTSRHRCRRVILRCHQTGFALLFDSQINAGAASPGRDAAPKGTRTCGPECRVAPGPPGPENAYRHGRPLRPLSSRQPQRLPGQDDHLPDPVHCLSASSSSSKLLTRLLVEPVHQRRHHPDAPDRRAPELPPGDAALPRSPLGQFAPGRLPGPGASSRRCCWRPVAGIMRDRLGETMITPASMRTILDSVGYRLEEAKETSRYLTSLLIFLGLLGTFYGLLQTASSVADRHPGARRDGGRLRRPVRHAAERSGRRLDRDRRTARQSAGEPKHRGLEVS